MKNCATCIDNSNSNPNSNPTQMLDFDGENFSDGEKNTYPKIMHFGTDTTSNSFTKYIIVFVVIVILARMIDLTFNIVIWGLIGIGIGYYLYTRPEVKTEEFKQVPQITNKFKSYPDIVDFLYSINTYYSFNPNAYEAMILSLNSFFDLHNQIMTNQMIYCKANAEVAIEFARQAQNNLQSMIYVLDPVRIANMKFHVKLSEFEQILNSYIKKMVDKCSKVSDPDPDPIRLQVPKPFNYDDVHRPKDSARGATASINSKQTTFEFY